MPKQTELKVSYSATIKASLPKDRFENVSCHEAVAETWDVQDLEAADIILFEQGRRDYLKNIVDARVAEDYDHIKEP